jgi:type VI secretion system secreted protein VgrG
MADNYRGSFRGLGAELRTDAYGALRAGAGWLISSEGIQHQASERDPSGDNTAGMAHLKQVVHMAKQLQQAASTHQTVGLAGITTKTTPSSAPSSATSATSAVKDSKPSAAKDPKNTSNASPLESLQQAVAGMVNNLPATSAPIIAVTGKAGIGMTAAQDVQWSVGQVANVMTGQGTQLITGGQFRAHSGQAIGFLSGVVEGGSNAAQSNGLQLIAALGKIQIEAHSDDIKVQAKQDINIMSSHAHIDWAAAKSISLSTEGGANLTIKEGNITVQCPGKILLQAGQKSFLSAERLDYKLPVMPKALLTLKKRRAISD